MQETRYGLRVEVSSPYEQAVTRATEALKSEGFGVLTTIDVKQTLKQKLGREFRKYVILGACNPPLADRALHTELEIGLLLPCNMIVYETEPRPKRRGCDGADRSARHRRRESRTAGRCARGHQRLRRALTSLERPH